MPKPARNKKNRETLITAVVAGAQGEIFELDGYGAVGMAGDALLPLTTANTVTMPHGGELMFLPDRYPVVFNPAHNGFETLTRNPYQPDEPLRPVAAFNSPGYVNTSFCAYEEEAGAGLLPLFAYGAVGWQGNGFRSAVVRVDREPRQDLRLMPLAKVKAGVAEMRRRLPRNRLRRHLETCALQYGCPAGKNFFLRRFEAPLPTAQTCNARCLGCISLQADKTMSSCQHRIDFTPSPEEIAAVALTHIERVENAVVSFGQGCEGDPLLAAQVIEPAIRRIRRATPHGTINLNSNGSLPQVATRLFTAGLDSIRVSLNSVRPACYAAYFRPKSYAFTDVIKTIDIALEQGKFVSLNYLNCPGFTDSAHEADALFRFLENHPIHLIQWRNLNYDPQQYCRAMAQAAPPSPAMGIEALLKQVRKRFPHLKSGYFNPPRENF